MNDTQLVEIIKLSDAFQQLTNADKINMMYRCNLLSNYLSTTDPSDLENIWKKELIHNIPEEEDIYTIYGMFDILKTAGINLPDKNDYVDPTLREFCEKYFGKVNLSNLSNEELCDILLSRGYDI